MSTQPNVVPFRDKELVEDASFSAPGNARPVIWIGALIVLLAFGGFGAWAALAPLDSAVQAEGTIVVESNRKVVQHLEGGIVRTIHVNDGDVVQKGQIVVTLDKTEPQARVSMLRKQLDGALALEARLLAERDGRDAIDFPEDLLARAGFEPHATQIVSGQRTQFIERRRSLEGQVRIFEQRIVQSRDEIRGMEAQIDSRERQIAILEDELGGLRTLYEKGHAPRSRILAMEREQVRLEGEIGADQAGVARAQNGIGEAEMQITQLRQQMREEVVTQLQEVQDRLADLEERYIVASDVLERRELRAPQSGVVQNLAVHTLGGVVQPGNEVMQVIPQNDRLVVEGRIPPQDIDRVLVGQEADVRMTALNPRSTPVLYGRVVTVSADRLEDEQDGTPYYRARVEVSDAEIARLGTETLRAGMPAQVLIKAGERTVADYLLKPLSDAMSRSFIEE